jgi:hypothetical protein
MSCQYSPKSFLRHVPKQLLKQFFDRRGQLRHMLWYTLGETEIDLIYRAWQALPEQERIEVESVFQAIDEMACETGIKALIEEAHFHQIDLASDLEPLKGLHHKSMWTYLRHGSIFELAHLFKYVEGLPNRSWVHIIQLPRNEPDASQNNVHTLETALSEYYQREQGRDRRCTVEYHLRGQRYHYFFRLP